MQAASDSVSSGLVSVFLSHKSKLNYALLCARKACSHVDRPVCSVANYLFPDVKVIGGHREVSESPNRSRIVKLLTRRSPFGL